VSEPPVSVVVCTYTERRWDDLVAAVGSVRAQRVPGLEVVVATDHNPRLAARVGRELAGVVATSNHGAPGLSDARNAGIAASRGHIVAFLDDDCVAAPGWLARLLAHFAAPHVVAAGGAVAPRWDARRPGWFPAEFDWVVGCSYRGLPAEATAVRNVIGANMAFRRHVLDAVGGFRAGLGRVGTVPLGCEETELCLRIASRLPSTRIVYDPVAVVEHRVPAARGSWRYFAARCWAEGRSKAVVARLAGRRRGLAAERQHVLHALPIGVLSGLRDAATGDAAGARRAAAIVAGLAITTSGYARGVVGRRAGA
jgi:glucosyl-dolichyl phosphate glucuronosyltransferase